MDNVKYLTYQYPVHYVWYARFPTVYTQSIQLLPITTDRAIIPEESMDEHILCFAKARITHVSLCGLSFQYLSLLKEKLIYIEPTRYTD